jgi:hypothetical protein
MDYQLVQVRREASPNQNESVYQYKLTDRISLVKTTEHHAHPQISPVTPTVAVPQVPPTVAVIQPSQLQSPGGQPYYLKCLTNQIKVCAGCRLGYSNRNPPYDICVVHRESRNILNPLTKQNMNVPVNVHYHATVQCIVMKDKAFEPTKVVIPDSLKEKVGAQMYRALLLQEFRISH